MSIEGQDEAASAQKHNGMTVDEIALYDRQIRLWGMAAQERMRNAHVLIISIRSLANEVIKNLVLAGIGAVTLMDHRAVSETDLGAQFLVSSDDIGQNRAESAAQNARLLNSRVIVNVETGAAEDKDDDYFAKFDLTVAIDQDLTQLLRLNGACRRAGRPFYAAEIPGMTGFVFADLIKHDFVTEREETNASGERQKITMPNTEVFTALSDILTHNLGATLRPKLRKKVSSVLPMTLALWDFRSEHKRYPESRDREEFQSAVLKALDRHTLPHTIASETLTDEYLAGSQAELSAIAAVVGGVLSQDVLNVLSGRENPIQNFFVFDGNTGDGPIYKI